jgi:uncharacterized protein
MKYWIETYTGKVFDYENIKENKVDIRDIAHALSNMCRFNGHCSQFYSVAEHSILVSEEIERVYNDTELSLKALLHDATETYMPDVPRPLKTLWSTKMDLRVFEDTIEDCILENFNLKLTQEDKIKIKIYDSAMLRAERNKFFEKKVLWNFPEGIPEINPLIKGYDPYWSENLFMIRFKKLMKKYEKIQKRR